MSIYCSAYEFNRPCTCCNAEELESFYRYNEFIGYRLNLKTCPSFELFNNCECGKCQKQVIYYDRIIKHIRSRIQFNEFYKVKYPEFYRSEIERSRAPGPK